MKWEKYNTPDFEARCLQCVRFWKCCSWKIKFWLILLCQHDSWIDSALGCTWVFYRIRQSFLPFSVDMSNFLTSFSVKSNTTIAIYLDHNALLFNQTHFVFERDNLFGTMTTIRYKINFQAQKRMNRKLCRILRRIFGFIIFVHHFMRKEKYPGLGQTLRTGFWSGAGIGEHLHQWLDMLVAGRRQLLLLLRTTFENWTSRVANCCFYTIPTFNQVIATLYGKLSQFCSLTKWVST